MVSGIYVCHWPDSSLEFSRCELLLHRTYHNDVPIASTIITRFSTHYLQRKPHERSPFLYHQGVTYVSLWGHNDILLLAVARRNINAMSTVSLLHQFYSVMTHYFSQQSRQNPHKSDSLTPHDSRSNRSDMLVTRDSIVDNHALLFELLDECVDFGLVQVTDFNILKEYIKINLNQGKPNHANDSDSSSDSDSNMDSLSSVSKSSRSRPSRKDNKKQNVDVKSTHNQAVRTHVVNDAAADFINSSIVRTQVSSISWRPKGIFYPKNEIYIDINEEVDFLYDLASQVVRRNQIHGVCSVRSYLSGMPVCKLGLNEKYISQVEYDGGELEDEIYEESEAREGNQLGAESGGAEEDTEEQTGQGSDGRNSQPQHRLMKVPITNVQFHSCIELSKLYQENLIFFTPPDDEFQLFSYSVEQQRRKRTKPLVLVEPVYRVLVKERKLQVMCSLSSNFRKRLHCQKMIIRIPVNSALFPLNKSEEETFRCKCEVGDVRFRVDTSEIVWAIGDLPGSKKLVRLMAEVTLQTSEHLTDAVIHAELFRRDGGSVPRAEADDDDSAISELDNFYGVGRASSTSLAVLQKSFGNRSNEISLSFEIPMLTYSGLKITYLRVDEDTMKYTCFPWVRYATRTAAGAASSHTDQVSNVDGRKLEKYRFHMGPSNFNIVC